MPLPVRAAVSRIPNKNLPLGADRRCSLKRRACALSLRFVRARAVSMPPVKRQPSQGKATSPTRKPGAADHIKRNSMVTNGASDGKLNELSKLNATKVDA